jgi:Carboxypeptidase regulatory-like domain
VAVSAGIGVSRRRWGIAALLALLGVAAGQGCGDGTEPGGVGTIRGRVSNVETTQTVEGVTITVAGHSTGSDASGFYRLDNVPAGTQTLTATHPSFQAYTAEVTITPAGETTQDIALLSGTGTPDAVTRLRATSGATEGTVRVEWEPAAHAASYNIYWSTSPGVTPATGTKILQVSSPYVHTGLAAGTTYYYIVTGVGVAGEGPPSPEVPAIARGSIEVQIVTPGAGGLVGEVVSVEAAITSAFSLAEVTAQIGGVAAPMSFDVPSGHWRAQPSLASLASPANVVVLITARDVNGNLGGSSVSARFDRHPTLVVTAPENGAVARPTAALQITCTDDSPGGCGSITVLEEEQRTVLFTGQGDINTTLSLAQYEGRKIFLEVHAADAAGQETVQPRYVFVESHPGLTPAASAGSGIVLDADADRLLVVNSAFGEHFPPPGDTARIVIRGTEASTTVFTDPTSTVPLARLTADGALLVTQQLAQAQVRQLRNGTLSTVTDANFIQDFQVEAGFATWLQSGLAGVATNELVWRDLAAGTSDVVASAVQGLADLAPNGDLVYVQDGEVFRYRRGVSQQQTDNASAGLSADFARTDGTLIVQQVRPATGSPAVRQMVLLDPGGDVVLASTTAVEQNLDARLNNGWIAFTRFDVGGVAQIWVRAPGGTETQLTFFGSSSGIVELSGNGEVVLANADQKLYRVSPGSSPTEIAGVEVAKSIFIGGVLHVMVGDVLFRVD